jgi:hypothetical protein
VNPAHLEPKGRGPNVLASLVAPTAVNARKTHCPKGHPYAGGNLYVKPRSGYRECRTCQQERNRQSYARKRAALYPPRIAELTSKFLHPAADDTGSPVLG